ncbi:30S ribosomal protein S28e [Candidatus Micrarchaeota archaeon]|nr:30S ribosomal protein S28e [Candidatus Micrarchaeota archaeon]
MEGTPVEVIKVLGKTGVYGEAYLALIKILDGKDKGQVRKRVVKGPLRKGDILMLLETEREHKGISGRRR